MSELFTRGGKAFTGQPGGSAEKPTHTVVDPCSRCGGRGGSDAWKFTGYTCYRCNGRGDEPARQERLYTAEQLAKLNATQAKKAANKQAKFDAARAVEAAAIAARKEAFQAEHADLLQWLSEAGVEHSDSWDDGTINYRDGFLGDMLRRANERAEWSEAQVAAIIKVRAQRLEERAKAATSRHVGTIGERLELTVTVERETSFLRRPFQSYRDHMEEVFVTTLRDAAGNALVVMSPVFREAVGSTISIRATVKDHKEFRGELQTNLNRVSVVLPGEEKPARAKRASKRIADRIDGYDRDDLGHSPDF